MLNEIEIKDIHQAKEYEWGTDCMCWTLLEDSAFTVMQEKMSPNTADELHYHQVATQFIYVLSGVLQVELNGKMFILKPQQGLKISKLLPHRVINNSDDETNFLLISSPGQVEDRVLENNK